MKRIFSFLTFWVIVCSLLTIGTFKVNAAYENNWVNTGDQALDIVEIAKTQLGYREGSNKSNKYSAAFNQPNVNWCAYFVSWCAKEAGISDSIIHRQGIASPFSDYFNIPNTHGRSNYFPKPGDLIFYGPDNEGDHYHVGLVETANKSTGYITTIEGNTTYSNNTGNYLVYRHTRHYQDSSICCYGTPNYKTTSVPAKPVPSTSKTSYVEGESVTISWNAVAGNSYYWISIWKDGTLIVNQTMDNKTTYTMTNLAEGEYKIAVSANNDVGNSGSSSVSFTVSAISAPVISSSKTNYKTGTTVKVSWDAVLNATSYVYYLSEYPNEYAYSTNVSSGTVTNPQVSFSNLPNGRYTIFVCSVSDAGKRSSQSNWLTFYVYNTDYVPVKTIEHNGHIYALYDTEVSWDFAKILCTEMGGHLATVTSEQENAYITELISYGEKDAYWLGANNVVTGSYKTTGEPFEWITGEPFEYTNWKSGEPSQSGERASLEHFLEVRKSYGNQWNDASNTNRKNKGFILEIDTTIYNPTAVAQYGDNKYLLFDNPLPWSIAQSYCESIGGHLVSITSAEEDEAVTALTKQGQKPWYFIGASKVNEEWMWSDDKAALSTGYSNWSSSSSWGNYLMKYKVPGYWIGINNFYSPKSNMERMGFVCEIDNAFFTVSYDANGGNSAPNNQIESRGKSLTICSTVPIRSGYVFRGWSMSPTGNTIYQPGDIYDKDCSVTLYAVWEYIHVGIVENWNITLCDDFKANFYIRINDSLLNNTLIKLTVANKAYDYPVSTLQHDENGNYMLNYSFTAAQMNDIISVQVVNGEEKSNTFTYTVRQYCDTILADEKHSQYHALVKEMLNYGAMAQQYFGYDTENLANDGITGVAATDVPETAEEMTVSDRIDSLNFYGASLVYRDRIAVRYYFTGDVTGMVFTVGSKTYTPIAKDGMYYIEIADILPQNLDQQITLTVTGLDGNTLTVSYGPMNYIVRMNAKGDEKTQNLLKALYNYHLAAKAL